MISEVAPATPYERVLAETRVKLEWQALRLRRIRCAQMTSGFRAQAQELFTEWNKGPRQPFEFDFDPSPDEDAVRLARALAERQPADAFEEARARLAHNGVTETEIVAELLFRRGPVLDRIERQLAEIEARRRRLRDDTDRVTRQRGPEAEDAQLAHDRGPAEEP